jgi:hypothetical protein
MRLNLETCCRRRLSYLLAAGAASATATSAEGVVIYSGPQELTVNQGSFQVLRLDGDSNDDAQLKNYTFTGGNYQGAFTPFAPGAFVGFSQNGINYATALGLGAVIDQSTIGPFQVSLAYGTRNPNAQFNNVANAYLGLGFPINNQNHFGWIRVSINQAAGTFVIHDWAYESVAGVALTIAPINLALPGDFNDNEIVDAADYTVYRDNLGSNNTLGGNGDETGASAGVVDAADYALWVAKFGQQNGAASAASTAVPEPLTLGLLAAGAGGLRIARRMRGKK